MPKYDYSFISIIFIFNFLINSIYLFISSLTSFPVPSPSNFFYSTNTKIECKISDVLPALNNFKKNIIIYVFIFSISFRLYQTCHKVSFSCIVFDFVILSFSHFLFGRNHLDQNHYQVTERAYAHGPIVDSYFLLVGLDQLPSSFCESLMPMMFISICKDNAKLPLIRTVAVGTYELLIRAVLHILVSWEN